jgi:hypothetical protein
LEEVMQHKTNHSDEIGHKHDQIEPAEPSGSERARDEQREGGPRYGGEAWKVADERGGNRFGKARNDDADPLEMSKRGDEAEDEETTASAPAEGQPSAQANEETNVTFGVSTVESGGDSAGMRRGEKPRKSKQREKRNPKPGAKIKTKRA